MNPEDNPLYTESWLAEVPAVSSDASIGWPVLAGPARAASLAPAFGEAA